MEERSETMHRQRLSMQDSGLLLDGITLIRRDRDGFGYRHVDELQKFFDWHVSWSHIEARLEKVTGLLNAGKTFEAIFIANLDNWIEAKPAYKVNFNPAEPRDDQGRWTEDSQQSDDERPIEDVQYRGFFHDVVVDDLLQGLAANGSKVLKNVKILGVNGVLAIPDGVSRPAQANKPYFIEVKTGNDPGFTPNQNEVYPLICVGGHATSFDPRITQLGLTPGVPFPPLDILLVRTQGPGMPLKLSNYCDRIVFGKNPDAP